jgi:3-hydroxyethyl bacteriochlorophyllide a dehydrogenase
VGHGVLGRLLARLATCKTVAQPVVWETNPDRLSGAQGYQVTTPEQDERRDYRCICDASGDPTILDSLIARLAPGGEIVLAGFYADRLSFAFPPAFMREARLRVAAEFRPADLDAVSRMVEQGRLSLDGLVTHRMPAPQAESAYRTAFGDPACLKMILDWRSSV